MIKKSAGVFPRAQWVGGMLNLMAPMGTHNKDGTKIKATKPLGFEDNLVNGCYAEVLMG